MKIDQFICDIDYVSCNLGIFLCKECAVIHRSVGVHISLVKPLSSKSWHLSELNFLEKVGNMAARENYQKHLPLSYRRPTSLDPLVVREQWVRAKYEREEFSQPNRGSYRLGHKEGLLWKKDKHKATYKSRKFMLSGVDNCLMYFTKNPKKPKGKLNLFELNVTFCPAKMENPNGMQIVFYQKGEVRCIFVYAEEGQDAANEATVQEIVSWYNAIRAAKLNAQLVAFPHETEAHLAAQVTWDFANEGWLQKSGPSASDPYRRRWFTMDRRHLMYFENPLDPTPRGMIFVGHRFDGFSVRRGVPPGYVQLPFGFTLITPNRRYLLFADNNEELARWFNVLDFVVETEPGPLDLPLSSRRSS
ncbi:ADAP2 [Cordylochernes scorpioides]|uniref:ADAP2 n=1 Tax=Cordylochernes scorpioides TaxID=51811 RepID=A0ABY6L498_9ARAC|nr:ADAP2 [Cordylochernes scorpioides]